MSANLYDAEFYAARRPLLPEYQAMGDILNQVFHPRMVLDIGCGPAEVLAQIRTRDVGVLGMDASPAAQEAATVPVIVVDATNSPISLQDADLVICMEVGEHIPESKADALVDFVARNTAKWLVWSAATPGQGGTGHINEQPMKYWMDKFVRHDLHWRWGALSEAMRLLFAAAAPRQPWYGKTTMVFERPR